MGRVGYVLPVNHEEGGLFEAVLIVGVYGTEEAAGDRASPHHDASTGRVNEMAPPGRQEPAEAVGSNQHTRRESNGRLHARFSGDDG